MSQQGMNHNLLTINDVTNHYRSKKRCTSFFHLNTQSACGKVDELDALFSSFGFSFDVIMLTETWYQEGHDMLKMRGYNTFHKNRIAKKGGGLLLIVKQNLNCAIIKDFTRTTEDFEMLALICKETVFCVLYRPPAGSVSVFLSYMETFFGWINENRLKLVLGGDININMLNATSAQHQFQNLLQSNALINTIATPTRFTPDCASLIDVFVTNMEARNLVSGVIGVNLSDHLPIFLMTENKTTTKAPKRTSATFQDINSLTLEAFRKELSTITWETVFSATDPNEAYDNFLSLFKSIYQKCFARKALSFRKARKPWITPHLLKLIKEKDALYTRFIRTKNLDDLRAFKTLRNTVTSSLRQAKRAYLFNLFNAEVMRKTDVLWKRLNNVLGRQQEHAQGSELILNGAPTSGAQLANAFNNFFVSLDSSSCNAGILNYLPPSNSNSAFLFPTDANEIFRTFLSFRNSKACDADDIQIVPIKHTLDITCPVLQHVYNLAFEKGIFPRRMQMAKVSVIFKGGDRNELSNYRPISILPVFSKGLEKLISERMSAFCEKHLIITNSQFGFRKHLSTESALLTQKEIILQAIENKLVTLGVFVDFSKAFDRINHAILLKKLEHYGFRGEYLTLLESYLQFRCQAVVIDNEISDYKAVKLGVPQGSILGPLLFLLYINDLISIDDSCRFVIYADDTTLLLSGKDTTKLLNDANNVLNKLDNWSIVNSLTINTSKTKAVLFKPTNSKACISNNLCIGTSSIEIVPSVKSLGVFFDEHLTWNKHIDNISSKLARVVGVLTRLRFFLPQKIKLLIYHSLFFSHLNYCLLVWGRTTATNITKLHLLQKKAVRAVSDSAYDAPTQPIFESLGVRPVHGLHDQKLIKSYNSETRTNCNFIRKLSNLTPHDTIYNTRHPEAWFVPCPRTNYGKQLLCYTLPCLLNSRNQ